MAVDDIYMATVYTVSGRRNQSFVLHYQEEIEADNPGDGSEISDACIVNFGTELIACLSAEVKFGSVIAYRLYPAYGLPGRSFAVNSYGGRGAEPIAQANSLVIQQITEGATNKNHGRIYLPGLAEDDTDGNSWDATFLSTQVAALAAKLKLNLNEASGAGSWKPVVLSTNGVPLFKGVRPLDITDVVPQPTVYRQRRRGNPGKAFHELGIP